jgi:2-haloalkanoic acid dehalogenase type II
MSATQPAHPPFPSVKALSFDIFGTLIDWENGILKTLTPLIRQLPVTHAASVTPHAAIAAFDHHERRLISSQPTILYDEALRQAYLDLAAEWDVTATREEAQAVVDNVKHWPCFPDTVAAMQRLGKRFKIIALSNVSRGLWEQVAKGELKDVKFDAVYVAEEIGSYKPDQKNFEFLVQRSEKDLGCKKEELLHVGHGVQSDQVPAEEMGIGHAWIERGTWNWKNIKPMPGMRSYHDLKGLADDVESVLKKT